MRRAFSSLNTQLRACERPWPSHPTFGFRWQGLKVSRLLLNLGLHYWLWEANHSTASAPPVRGHPELRPVRHRGHAAGIPNTLAMDSHSLMFPNCEHLPRHHWCPQVMAIPRASDQQCSSVLGTSDGPRDASSNCSEEIRECGWSSCVTDHPWQGLSSVKSSPPFSIPYLSPGKTRELKSLTLQEQEELVTEMFSHHLT